MAAVRDIVSLGTPVISGWMTMVRRVHPHLVLTYMASVSAFYALVGAAIVAGRKSLRPSDLMPIGHQGDDVVLLVLGLALLASGLMLERWTGSQRSLNSYTPLRRIALIPGTTPSMMRLGLAAHVLELASMISFLSALTNISTHETSLLAGSLKVFLYVAVTAAPARGLLACPKSLKRLLREQTASLWSRVGQTGSTVSATALMAVGGLVAANGAIGLGLMHPILTTTDGDTHALLRSPTTYYRHDRRRRIPCLCLLEPRPRVAPNRPLGLVLIGAGLLDWREHRPGHQRKRGTLGEIKDELREVFEDPRKDRPRRHASHEDPPR